MKNLSILFVAYYYPPPDHLIGAARPYRFAKYLERMGHRITILAASTGAKTEVNGNVHRLRTEDDFLLRPDPHFPTRVIRKFLWWDIGYFWTLRAALYGRRLVRSARPSVIISTSPPLATHFVALWLKKRFGLPWIADFRDPFVGHRKSRNNLWLDPRIEAMFFRNADLVIANTEQAAEIWRRGYPEMRERIVTIWNGFDPEEAMGPLPLPDRSRKLLTHVGSIYEDRNPGVLLRSLDRLIQSERLSPSAIRVDLTGHTDREALSELEIVDRLQTLGCLTLTPKVSRKEAQRIMATSDYLLLLDVFTGRQTIQLPGKTFEYVRIGRPVLACTMRDSPLEGVLRHSGIDHVMLHDTDSSETVDEKVLQFLSLPTEPREAHEQFRNMFDGARQSVYLSGLVEELARHSTGLHRDRSNRSAPKRTQVSGADGAE
ncbi:MAG: glycosyltransferase [Bryobacteraceae bacterium]